MQYQEGPQNVPGLPESIHKEGQRPRISLIRLEDLRKSPWIQDKQQQ